MLKFTYHRGYYNSDHPYDSFSDKTFYVDFSAEIMTCVHKHNDSEYSYNPQTDETSEPLRVIPVELAQHIIDTLEPLFTTITKYPHLSTFKYFSDKHYRLIVGRITKAIKLAGDYVYYAGTNDHTTPIFIMPDGTALELLWDRRSWHIRQHDLYEDSKYFWSYLFESLAQYANKAYILGIED